MSEIDHQILNKIYALSNDESIPKQKRELKKEDKKQLKSIINDITENLGLIKDKPDTLISYEIDMIERGIHVLPKNTSKSFKVLKHLMNGSVALFSKADPSQLFQALNKGLT